MALSSTFLYFSDVNHPQVQTVSSSEMAVQHTQSSENVPAKSGGLNEEEFGPRLPPPGQSLTVISVVYTTSSTMSIRL